MYNRFENSQVHTPSAFFALPSRSFRLLFLLIFGLFLTNSPVIAQQKDSAKIKISAYVDAYYGFYTDKLPPNTFQLFPSISPRSNEFGLNTAQVTFNYENDKVRAVATVHYGDIAKCLWSPTFNNVMEANVGVRLSKTLWIDGGFFRTHFGTEGLLPIENFGSCVSVNTFYEPSFESGVRLNYTPSKKLTINVYALNGYNMFEDNNDHKSLGTVITYLLGEKGNIGYSNYIGDDSPIGDSASHNRIHQNLFFNYEIKKLKIRIGGDYCMQQNSNILLHNQTASMYSGIVSAKFQCRAKCAMYVRGEIFNDPDAIMSGIVQDAKGKLTGFNLMGVTIGTEYKPTENTCIRLEARQIQMDKDQQLFWWNGLQSNRLEVLLDLGIVF